MTPDFASALRRLNNGRIITGAGSLATAYSLSLAVQQGPPLWVVCADADSAAALQADLQLMLGDRKRLLSFPAEDLSPYSLVTPKLDVTAQRQAHLLALVNGLQPEILLTHAPGLQQRGLSLPAIKEASLTVSVGDSVDRDALILHLLQAGFVRATQVEDLGAFAVRGSLIDIYAASTPGPLRIDLFGDEVEGLFIFDPESQRNLHPIKEAHIAPLRDLLHGTQEISRAKQGLRELADAHNFPSRKLRHMLHDLELGIPFFGMEALAPLFARDPLPSLFSRIQSIAPATGWRLVLVDSEGVQQSIDAHWDKLHQSYARALEKNRLVVSPELHLQDPQELWAQLQTSSQLQIETWAPQDQQQSLQLSARSLETLRHELQQGAQQSTAGETPKDLFAPLRRELKSLQKAGVATIILARGQAGLQRVRALLQDHDLKTETLAQLPDMTDTHGLRSLFRPGLHAWLCPVSQLPSQGAVFAEQGFALLSEEDFFGKRSPHDSRSKRSPYKTNLAELDPGDVVVHVEFGIGLYQGLVRLNLGSADSDFLLIHYRDDDKLYLPVTRINQVQRYAGADSHVPRLDKLGGQSWSKTRARVKRAILAMAQELLAIYARRKLAQGSAMPAPDAMYREFTSRFLFDETPDQARAIDDTLADLQKNKPMDRLVCGDVGYGKTEVALRATMLTVLGGHQVAVLAPTTVLAQQHYLTFAERFSGFPVQIEVLSRLRNKAEASASLKRLQSGQVDVVIGTHRLLSHDVDFSKLGLLIVDEEHRFGVKDKERIKALRAGVHVLSMSATPIPRTLQMSFFGIRDLSVIDTPPVDRRAIRTTVSRFDEDLIREAIDRELGRGGQVFVVHNRVQSIDAFAGYIRRLLPSAQVCVAHGQMSPSALEKVMLGFISGEKNVLVSTTIIESGIDIPRANTMIVNRADRLGLAQLYQLRGRIGRSHQRAYAYLLVPPSSDSMTPQARKRLEILQRFVDLGAGFKIARHDLELRGAGDILGKSQHGHVAAVGYEMYAELLQSAVHELQGQGLQDVPEPELNVHVSAYIPDDYVFDIHERLQHYQRMATAPEIGDVYEAMTAMEERYGKTPEPVRTLAEVMVLKVMLKRIAARGLDLAAPVEGKQDPPRVIISLGEQSRLDPAALVAWVASQPQRLRLSPQMRLYLNATTTDWLGAEQDMLGLARRFINELSEKAGIRAASYSGGQSN